MSALLVLVVGLVAGIVAGVTARRHGRVDDGAHQMVNFWVLDVALPALALHVLHSVIFPANLLLIVAGPYLLFAFGATLFLSLGRVLHLRRDVVGALIVTAAVANTSFVGIPMVTAFFGAESVPVALLVDQLGSFIIVGTAVIAVAATASGAGVTRAEIARRLLTAPALIALLTGLVLRPVAFPGWLTATLTTLGSTLTPLALFSIGLQLRIGAVRAWRRELAIGLLVKLVIGPALVFGVYALAGSLGDHGVQVALFETAMPPMVAGAMIAMRYGLATPLPSLMVGVGVPVSLLTLPIWSWILQG
ncbi:MULTISPECIES: AEC family transporter [unclassified Frankia]|uniref:AEC family transporter n=1 Tax=unclassified Frankia TaxID=2632575 RepID=UPI001EF65741|nr:MULTISPECIES: AEC family transporter [unclassified Frankia]